MIDQFRQLHSGFKSSLNMLAKKENMLTLEDIVPSARCISPKKDDVVTVSFLDMMPLEDSVRSDTDFFILERLKIISLKDKWSINEATLAIKDACTNEWYRRYGNNVDIPNVELSKEAIAQLEAEKEFWFE